MWVLGIYPSSLGEQPVPWITELAPQRPVVVFPIVAILPSREFSLEDGEISPMSLERMQVSFPAPTPGGSQSSRESHALS